MAAQNPTSLPSIGSGAKFIPASPHSTFRGLCKLAYARKWNQFLKNLDVVSYSHLASRTISDIKCITSEIKRLFQSNDLSICSPYKYNCYELYKSLIQVGGHSWGKPSSPNQAGFRRHSKGQDLEEEISHQRFLPHMLPVQMLQTKNVKWHRLQFFNFYRICRWTNKSLTIKDSSCWNRQFVKI